MKTASAPIPRNKVLHQARLRSGHTQNSLALAIQAPEFLITKLETKRRKMDSETAGKLSAVLKVSARQLCEGGELV